MSPMNTAVSMLFILDPGMDFKVNVITDILKREYRVGLLKYRI